MLYKTINDLVGTARDAAGDGWMSRRFLIAEDGFPFSVHETTVLAGTTLHINYSEHAETVYCVAGKAVLEDLVGNRTLGIRPGTFYSVGIGDEHILRIEVDTTFLCIFNPPLTGQEEAKGTDSSTG